MKNAEQIVSKDEKFDSLKYWVSDSIDIDNRRIRLSGAVDEDKLDIIFAAIRRMVDVNTEAIYVYINSYGGDIYDAFGIYDILRACKHVDIHTVVSGKVMSAAAIIFLAGDFRYCSPNSRFMIHEVSDEEIAGKNHDVQNAATELKIVNEKMIEIISDHVDLSVKKLRTLIKDDTYYWKEEALELGFVTEKEYTIE